MIRPASRHPRRTNGGLALCHTRGRLPSFTFRGSPTAPARRYAVAMQRSDAADAHLSPPRATPGGGGAKSVQDELKRQAAVAALTHVRPGMTVGLGSGSTAALFIEELGRRLADGSLSQVRGIPTSEASRELATAAGIPLIDFADAPGGCDVVVDGADEIDPRLDLIKGLGGALLREKIVAQNARRRVIIADGSKLVDKLGSKAALPVEVLPYGIETQPAFFRGVGGEPVLRLDHDGRPYRTDNGNAIYDVAFGPMNDPRELEVTLLRRAGVVQTGLFLGMADEAIVAVDGVVRTMVRA